MYLTVVSEAFFSFNNIASLRHSILHLSPYLSQLLAISQMKKKYFHDRNRHRNLPPIFYLSLPPPNQYLVPLGRGRFISLFPSTIPLISRPPVSAHRLRRLTTPCSLARSGFPLPRQPVMSRGTDPPREAPCTTCHRAAGGRRPPGERAM